MATSTMSYDARGNQLRSPTTFSYHSQPLPWQQATDPAGGLDTYVYENSGAHHGRAVVPPGQMITSMAFSHHGSPVEPVGGGPSLTWDAGRPRTARVAQTMTTLIGAVDVVRRSPPASEEDRLDAELLAALDGLLSTSDMTPEQFWDAFREDERCAGIFGSLCREAARKFGLNAEAVLNGALYGLWRSLNAQDPHEWLAKPRQDFIAWFSGVVKNKVRNATRSEARCDSRIVRIDKLSREAYCLEHVSARPGDPGLVMDFFDAVDEMPEDLRAVFLLHDLPQPVGPDESRKLSDLKIAKRLRISVSTVKRRWCDAQAYLQRHLPDLRIDV